MSKAEELLSKALDFIVETQEENDYICEQMCEECKKHYCKVADKCHLGKNNLQKVFYMGKADVYVDLLKHFEPLEPWLTFIRLIVLNNTWSIAIIFLPLQYETKLTNITL